MDAGVLGMTRQQQTIRRMSDSELRAEYQAAMRPDRLWDVIAQRIAMDCCIEASRRGIHVSGDVQTGR